MYLKYMSLYYESISLLDPLPSLLGELVLLQTGFGYTIRKGRPNILKMHRDIDILLKGAAMFNPSSKV